jgi:hypothetical protein
MQLYWHATAPHYAELQTVPENRVYVSPDRADAFVNDFTAFANAKVNSDDRKAPGVEIGRPEDVYRRVEIESLFGKVAVLGTDGHLPFPYRRETTGYEVDDLSESQGGGSRRCSGALRRRWSPSGDGAVPRRLYRRNPFCQAQVNERSILGFAINKTRPPVRVLGFDGRLRQGNQSLSSSDLVEIRADHRSQKVRPEISRGPAIRTGPLDCLLSAFGDNRRRRGFALADVGLCGGRDAKERQSRCRQ